MCLGSLKLSHTVVVIILHTRNQTSPQNNTKLKQEQRKGKKDEKPELDSAAITQEAKRAA